MWTGIKIDEVKKSVYGNFYSENDYAIIDSQKMPDKKDVKRLINKARKYGDTMTSLALEDIYDGVLYTPTVGEKAIIPPRAKIEAELAVIMESTYKYLFSLNC